MDYRWFRTGGCYGRRAENKGEEPFPPGTGDRGQDEPGTRCAGSRCAVDSFGGGWHPTYYTYSATNLRLQEAHIGYTVPRRWLGNVCDINVSLVGRNLWMIYCKAPFDPEAVATTNNYYQGIDYFMMPSTRNIGFNIKINF